MYVNSIPDNAEFDYVIVGAGSAGCMLADKLSANGKHQVLLLEAGGRDTSFNIKVPLYVAHVLNDASLIWPYMTEPQTHLNGQAALDARTRDRRLQFDQRQSVCARRSEGIRPLARAGLRGLGLLGFNADFQKAGRFP